MYYAKYVGRARKILGEDVNPRRSSIRLATPLLAGSVLSFVGRSVLSLFQLFAKGRHCYTARATR